MKKQSLWVAVVVSLLMAVGLPFFTGGSFIHVAVMALVVLLSLALMAAAGAVFLFSRWKGSETLRQRLGRMLAVALVGIAQWASIPVINHLSDGQLAAARGYCESLVPEVERFRLRHGGCPEGIADLSGSNGAPDFLREQKFFWVSHGSGATPGKACEFGFQFRLPSSPPLVVHRYDSASGEWRVDD